MISRKFFKSNYKDYILEKDYIFMISRKFFKSNYKDCI